MHSLRIKRRCELQFVLICYTRHRTMPCSSTVSLPRMNMGFPLRPSDQEAKCRMVVNGFSTVKESEAAAIDNKDFDNRFFFDARVIVHHEFVPQGQTVNQEVYISALRRMRKTLRRCCPDLWPSGQWTLLHNNARPHTALSVSRFLTKHNITVLPHPPYSPDLSPCDFFLFP